MKQIGGDVINQYYGLNDIFDSFLKREEYIKKYAWAIPNEEAIRICTKYSPLVEIGAGNGYWAKLIREAGGTVYTYDCKSIISCKAVASRFVVNGFPEDVARHNDCNLFLCWPPYDVGMAANCLKHFSGKYVIYIGEGRGGCTADDRFHDILATCFTDIETVNIPQWPGVHDYLSVLERK